MRTEFLRTDVAESERSDRFKPDKILKIFEHARHSIRYCKIQLLLYSGRGNQSNIGLFLTPLAETSTVSNSKSNLYQLNYGIADLYLRQNLIFSLKFSMPLKGLG